MALQVWLPLTKEGDFKNRGLADISVTDNGATYNSSGKLGGCYDFSSNQISFTNSLTSFIVSYGAWVNFTGSNTYLYLISLHSENSGRSTALFELDLTASGTSSLRIYYCIKGTSNTYSFTPTLNTWYHIFVTFDGTIAKLYINGELKNTSSVSNDDFELKDSNTKIYIGTRSGGGSSTYLKGCLNDIRIYDKCLTASEVKKIAKGLVGHWCLNDWQILRNKFSTSNNWNLLCKLDDTNGIRLVSGLITTKINECTVHIEGTSTGSWTSGDASPIYMTPTNLISGHKILIRPITKGTCPKITFRCFLSNGVSISTSTIYTVTGSGGTGIIYIYNYNGVTEWNTDITVMIFDLTSIYGEGNEPESVDDFIKAFPSWYYPYDIGSTKNLKLTGIPDISGLHNDLTINGTVSLSDDTPRYDKCINFSGSSYLIGTLYPLEETSISFWINRNSLTGTRLFIYTGWLGISIELTTSNEWLIYYTYNSSETISCSPSTKLEAGIWYHCTLVIGKSEVAFYINGTKEKTATYLPPYYSTKIMNIGNYANFNNFNAKLSDFRVYATALSADDIQELYKLGNV